MLHSVNKEYPELRDLRGFSCAWYTRWLVLSWERHPLDWRTVRTHLDLIATAAEREGIPFPEITCPLTTNRKQKSLF